MFWAPPMNAKASVRLTGTSAPPTCSVAIQLVSRTVLIFRAIRSTASSQLMSTHRSLPAARYFGTCNRCGDACVGNIDMPLTQSEPRLTTWS
jgi:hypothetical protein